jgi:hypothetical protein
VPVNSVESEVADSTNIKESKSISSFGAVRDSISSTFASLQLASPEQKQTKQDTQGTSSTPSRPNLEQRETDTEVLAKYVATEDDRAASNNLIHRARGDPLGVSAGGEVPEVPSGRLDFAAFAQGSAYSER